MFTAYETPEIRSLFNKNLLNVAGKQRSESIWPPLQVPEGLKQVRTCISLSNAKFDFFSE
jgi:U3 small nucleolar RNA-associated protein 25